MNRCYRCYRVHIMDGDQKNYELTKDEASYRIDNKELLATGRSNSESTEFQKWRRRLSSILGTDDWMMIMIIHK